MYFGRNGSYTAAGCWGELLVGIGRAVFPMLGILVVSLGVYPVLALPPGIHCVLVRRFGRRLCNVAVAEYRGGCWAGFPGNWGVLRNKVFGGSRSLRYGLSLPGVLHRRYYIGRCPPWLGSLERGSYEFLRRIVLISLLVTRCSFVYRGNCPFM